MNSRFYLGKIFAAFLDDIYLSRVILHLYSHQDEIQNLSNDCQQLSPIGIVLENSVQQCNHQLHIKRLYVIILKTKNVKFRAQVTH